MVVAINCNASSNVAYSGFWDEKTSDGTLLFYNAVMYAGTHSLNKLESLGKRMFTGRERELLSDVMFEFDN